MKRFLLLLLAIGLWQISCAGIHCDLGPSDCEEFECELCAVGDIAPLVPDIAQVCSPPAARRLAVAPTQSAVVQSLPGRKRGRAPPRSI